MWTEWKGMAWWIGRQRLTLGPSTNPDSGLNAMDQIHFRGAYTGGWDFRVTVGSVLIDLKIGGVGLKLKASGQAWESWQVLITSWLPFGTKTRGRMKPRIPWKPLLTYNQLLTTPESEDQSLSLIPTGSLGGWGSAASTYHVRDFFFFEMVSCNVFQGGHDPPASTSCDLGLQHVPPRPAHRSHFYEDK
jgi:hypothetical protein